MPLDHPPATSSPVLYHQRARTTYRPAAVVEAGAAGAVFGWLLGRRHHPLVLAGLFALVLGLVALVVMLWWAVLISVVLVCLARARSHGWSLQRTGMTAAALVGTGLLVLLGGLALGVGGALVAGCLGWCLWHAFARQHVRAL